MHERKKPVEAISRSGKSVRFALNEAEEAAAKEKFKDGIKQQRYQLLVGKITVRIQEIHAEKLRLKNSFFKLYHSPKIIALSEHEQAFIRIMRLSSNLDELQHYTKSEAHYSSLDIAIDPKTRELVLEIVNIPKKGKRRHYKLQNRI
jgi:hypothetical protein